MFGREFLRNETVWLKEMEQNLWNSLSFVLFFSMWWYDYRKSDGNQCFSLFLRKIPNGKNRKTSENIWVSHYFDNFPKF